MGKKVLILVALSLAAIASLSTFFELSTSGSFAGAPIVTNAYAVVTFFVVVGIALYIMLRK